MATLGTVQANAGRALRFWFEVSVFKESVKLTPDTDSVVVEDDKSIIRFTTATTGEQVTLTPLLSYGLEDDQVDYVFVSNNPTKIGVDAAGNVVFHVAPAETATAIITITGTQATATSVRNVPVTLTTSGAANIDVIDAGVEGSARKALSDVIDNALSGANPNTQHSIYTSQDHSTPAYVRNESLFIAGTHVEALTCMSPWNSVGGTRRAGTAITKRHVALAAHYSYGAGTTVRFIASDNTVVDRTVVQSKRVYVDGIATDVQIALLDSDLPASITPCKIFPANFETYLPAGLTTTAGREIPLVAGDFQEQLIVLDIHEVDRGYSVPTSIFVKPKKADRIAFYEPIIVGDSGNPVFAVIGSELWLLSTFYSAGSGPWYGGLIPELNDMITTLDTLEGISTGYTVTEGDLSSYTDYS